MTRGSFPEPINSEELKSHNYKLVTKDIFNTSTDKQLKLFNDLKETCKRVGIKIDFDLRVRNRQDMHNRINALYSVLKRCGYDGYGNPIKSEREIENE